VLGPQAIGCNHTFPEVKHFVYVVGVYVVGVYVVGVYVVGVYVVGDGRFPVEGMSTAITFDPT
jgi:hypothetical protein